MSNLLNLKITAGNRHSRTVGSAKKFVRITSGFGGGEFTKDASQGMYMSKIEICFFTARILQNERMLCCGECFHD